MIVAPPDRVLPAELLGRVHFVGIGGAGMSGIAKIMLARGIVVSGSDVKDSSVLTGLRALGATIHVGHSAAYVAGGDTVVVSTAIRETNPEVVEARQRGLRVLPRAAALASVMAGRRAVAVAGTHGKTTTTSMLTIALQHCGADPSFAIGGQLNESGANAHNGSGRIFVAEADESDGSFLVYDPQVSIITNVEADHLDNYRTADAYTRAFDAFALRAKGFLVVCADDPGALTVGMRARAAGVQVRTYGECAEADVRVAGIDLAGIGVSFDVVEHDRNAGRLHLRVPGRHNALNAAAALTAGMGLGYTSHQLCEGLAGFTGTRRRFEFKGYAAGVWVYDDYAHHPTEVAAVLTAARP
ncbi:MAG: UDP-N-acetylmuramate--L-alanine ligase, partial [Jiangellaceae bacterium]|nr:UDP-N-acetylmuramate--L-alanine ligase [Jiangellaceae bacterium]